MLNKIKLFYNIMFYHCDRLDYFMSHWFHNHLARPMIKLFPRTYWRKAIRNSRYTLRSSIVDSHDGKLCSMLVFLPFVSLIWITMGIVKLLFPFLDSRNDTFYWTIAVPWLVIIFVFSNKVEKTDKERIALVQKCMKKDKKWHQKWKLIIVLYIVLSLYFSFYVSIKFMSLCQ